MCVFFFLGHFFSVLLAFTNNKNSFTVLQTIKAPLQQDVEVAVQQVVEVQVNQRVCSIFSVLFRECFIHVF